MTLHEVVKTYGDVVAVDRVSLEVADGEFVALVGPSGCGKTTTLNLIAGLIDITSGEILLGDRQINTLDPKDRDLAMVFQNYALYPNKTVFENLAFPLRMRKVAKAGAGRAGRRTANVLSIDHLLDRHPRQLSGGQQQRVALGRALVRNPQAFLMDEPLSNLDAKLRVQMRAELKRFHLELQRHRHLRHARPARSGDHGRPHRGHAPRACCSSTPLPDEIFHHPVNTFVAGFIGSPAMNLLRGRVTTQDGQAAIAGEGGWLLPLEPGPARRALASSGESSSAFATATSCSRTTPQCRAGWPAASTLSSPPAISRSCTQAWRHLLVASADADSAARRTRRSGSCSIRSTCTSSTRRRSFRWRAPGRRFGSGGSGKRRRCEAGLSAMSFES